MMTTADSVVKWWGRIAYICLLLLVAISNAPSADEDIHAVNSVVSLYNVDSLNHGANKSVVDVPNNSNKNFPVASATKMRSRNIFTTSGGTFASSTKVTGVSNELASIEPVSKTNHGLSSGTIDINAEGYDAFSTVVYIIVGLTIVILAYMAVKNFRRQYTSVRVERYGVRRRCRDQELQPLGKDDDDEDTLFEARGGFYSLAQNGCQ